MQKVKRLLKSLSSHNNIQDPPLPPKFILTSLPAEILYCILSLLSLVDLVSLGHVCKEVKGVTCNEFIWKILYEQNWKKVIASPKKGKVKGRCRDKDDKMSDVSYREMFKLRRKYEASWKANSFTTTDLTSHLDDVICLQYVGDLLATGSGDGTVKLWDLKKKKCKASLKHTIDVFCLQLDNDNKLASGGGERHITIWDIAQQSVISKLPCKDTIKCLQIMDSILICGSADGFIYKYDLRTGSIEEQFASEIEDVWCLQAGGNNLVCGGVHATKPLRMFDLRTSGKQKTELVGHYSLVSSLHFEDDVLVTGSSDSSVRVWDMTTGKCKQRLLTTSKVFCVYLYDNWVVSGCDNAAAILWNVNTGEQVARYNPHHDAVLCAQFDTQRMVTGSYDKTIKVWDLAVTR